LKKIIKYILIILAVIIVLIVAGVSLIAVFYEDEVKQYVVEELNKHINTGIDVGNVEFSVFRKFPDASLVFNNVTAHSAGQFNKNDFKDNADTLLVAENIYLQFNIIDILKKKYIINKVHVNNGRINILIDRKGNDNYHFWREQEEADPDFRLELNNILLTKVRVSFNNMEQDIRLLSYTDHLDIAGDFYTDEYSLNTDGKLVIEDFTLDDTEYVNSGNFAIQFGLDVRNDQYSINKGEVRVSDLRFDVSGKFSITEKSEADIRIKGRDIDLSSFLSLLPDKYDDITEKYGSDGNFYFTAGIQGEISKQVMPHIEASFGMEDGEISQRDSDIRFKKVYLIGEFSNGSKNRSETSYLHIDTVNAFLGNSKISGKYSVENFVRPGVHLDVNTEIDLADINEFFRIDTVEHVEGKLVSNVVFNGRLKDPVKFTSADFRNSKTQGTLALQDAKLKLKDSQYEYSGIDGGFTFNNNDIIIDSLSFDIFDNDISMKGYLKNILSYIMVEGQSLFIRGDISSSDFRMDDLMDSEDEDPFGAFVLPDDITFAVGLGVDHFTFGKFMAEDIRGKLLYKNKKLAVNSASLRTMNGMITGDAEITTNRDNDLILKTLSRVENIDIKKMFYSFDNFGQDFIMDEHLKGNITADVDLLSEWRNDLTVKEGSVIAESDVTITYGELIGFEPMKRLSKYIELSELEHVKFSTLKNKIIIRDRIVTIPTMDINSTAFNIVISGTHTFDNEILYKLKVLLSEVLAKKARRKKENREFGRIEDDGLGRTSLHLTIEGTVDDYRIFYDTKDLKEHIKESLREEKQELKQILKEEFGWFRKDSTLRINKDTVREKSPIIIEWDEEDPE